MWSVGNSKPTKLVSSILLSKDSVFGFGITWLRTLMLLFASLTSVLGTTRTVEQCRCGREGPNARIFQLRLVQVSGWVILAADAVKTDSSTACVLLSRIGRGDVTERTRCYDIPRKIASIGDLRDVWHRAGRIHYHEHQVIRTTSAVWISEWSELP